MQLHNLPVSSEDEENDEKTSPTEEKIGLR
jgi:hypothetical protein